MPLLCRLGRHSTRPSTIANQGYYFSSCTRCGRPMIGSAVKWKAVPRALRVVWKPVRRDRAALRAWTRNLPMVIPQRIEKPRRSRRRFHFADLVTEDFKLLAWAGASGLKMWHTSIVARLVALRRRSSDMPVIRMG